MYLAEKIPELLSNYLKTHGAKKTFLFNRLGVNPRTGHKLLTGKVLPNLKHIEAAQEVLGINMLTKE